MSNNEEQNRPIYNVYIKKAYEPQEIHEYNDTPIKLKWFLIVNVTSSTFGLLDFA